MIVDRDPEDWGGISAAMLPGYAENVSRAYDLDAWRMIDLLRSAAELPYRADSFWPDMRDEMRQLADTRAAKLLRRMTDALSLRSVPRE